MMGARNGGGRSLHPAAGHRRWAPASSRRLPTPSQTHAGKFNPYFRYLCNETSRCIYDVENTSQQFFFLPEKKKIDKTEKKNCMFVYFSQR